MAVPGRTVPYTPLSGKYGYVTINGVNINVFKWTPTGQVTPLDVSNFNSPQDGNLTPHSEWIAGKSDQQFQITGVVDASATGVYPTQGDVGTGVLGYDEDIFFDIEYLVISVGGGTDIAERSLIDFTIKANGLCVLSSAILGAGGAPIFPS